MSEPRHHLIELWLAELAEAYAQALAKRGGLVLGACLALQPLLAAHPGAGPSRFAGALGRERRRVAASPLIEAYAARQLVVQRVLALADEPLVLVVEDALTEAAEDPRGIRAPAVSPEAARLLPTAVRPCRRRDSSPLCALAKRCWSLKTWLKERLTTWSDVP